MPNEGQECTFSVLVKYLGLVRDHFNQVDHLKSLPFRLSVVSRGDEDLVVEGGALSETSLKAEYRKC